MSDASSTKNYFIPFEDKFKGIPYIYMFVQLNELISCLNIYIVVMHRNKNEDNNCCNFVNNRVMIHFTKSFILIYTHKCIHDTFKFVLRKDKIKVFVP